jgi:hypothetical protein
MFFLKALAAMVTADAIDRHRRQQQRQAWLAEDARRHAGHVAVAAWPDPHRAGDDAVGSDLAARQRLT